MTQLDDEIALELQDPELQAALVTVTVTTAPDYVFDGPEGEGTWTPTPFTPKVSPLTSVVLKDSEFSLVETGDSQTTLINTGSLGFVPEKQMELTHDGRVFSVVEVREMYSGTRIAAWRLLLRLKGNTP